MTEQYRSLYEVTGNICDINLLIVQRLEIRSAYQQGQLDMQESASKAILSTYGGATAVMCSNLVLSLPIKEKK